MALRPRLSRSHHTSYIVEANALRLLGDHIVRYSEMSYDVKYDELTEESTYVTMWYRSWLPTPSGRGVHQGCVICA